jgi:hypothetical integral membrane protein (TIGR02206 family)
VNYFAQSGHLAALLFLGTALGILTVTVRRYPGRIAKSVRFGLAVALIGNEVFYVGWEIAGGEFSAQHSLPLYLCDVSAIVAGIALVTLRPLLVELTYFWGLAGSVQGMLTPDSDLPFASYQYLQFYFGHGGVIVAAAILVVGMGRHPRAGSVARVFAITLAFTVVVGLVDVVTGGDYMYLRSAPSSGSLLNLMGPWPWYIASGAVVALIFLLVLDAPFWRERRRLGPVTAA